MKTKKLLSVMLAICMLLSVVPMMAFTANAAGGGGVGLYDTDGTTFISTTFNCVQDAIDAATPGQVVRLYCNTTENISVSADDDIILDLNGYVLQGDGVLPTAESLKHCVVFNNGTLTVQDSSTSNNKAYFIYNSDAAWEYIASPSQEQITNAVDYAVNMDRSTLTSGTSVIAVTGGCITGGTGYSYTTKYPHIAFGGGIYNEGTLYVQGGNIAGNIARAGGGGIYNGGALYVQGGSIMGNYAGMDGGGIRNAINFAITTTNVYYSAADISNCNITDNISTSSGGGIYATFSLTVSNCNIANNTAGKTGDSWDDWDGGGGGMYASSITVSDSNIINNTSNSYSGGIMVQYRA